MDMQNNQISDIFQPYFAHFPPIQNPFLYVEKFLTFSSIFWTNSISLIFQWKNPALAISDAFSMPTCTRQTCVKAGIWSIPSLHAKKRQTWVKMGVWSFPFWHTKQGRHVLKGVSVQFHAFCRKGQTCVRFMCVWSIPSFYSKQGRHVWKEVSNQFHVFGRKGQTCMSWMSNLFYTPEQRFWLIPV